MKRIKIEILSEKLRDNQKEEMWRWYRETER
jgi:hypothetical protein